MRGITLCYISRSASNTLNDNITSYPLPVTLANVCSQTNSCRWIPNGRERPTYTCMEESLGRCCSSQRRGRIYEIGLKLHLSRELCDPLPTLTVICNGGYVQHELGNGSTSIEFLLEKTLFRGFEARLVKILFVIHLPSFHMKIMRECGTNPLLCPASQTLSINVC